jgi:hypothetical protein
MMHSLWMLSGSGALSSASLTAITSTQLRGAGFLQHKMTVAALISRRYPLDVQRRASHCNKRQREVEEGHRHSTYRGGASAHAHITPLEHSACAHTSFKGPHQSQRCLTRTDVRYEELVSSVYILGPSKPRGPNRALPWRRRFPAAQLGESPVAIMRPCLPISHAPLILRALGPICVPHTVCRDN